MVRVFFDSFIHLLQRREWIWFSQVAHDEHKDWVKFHQVILFSQKQGLILTIASI